MSNSASEIVRLGNRSYHTVDGEVVCEVASKKEFKKTLSLWRYREKIADTDTNGDRLLAYISHKPDDMSLWEYIAKHRLVTFVKTSVTDTGNNDDSKDFKVEHKDVSVPVLPSMIGSLWLDFEPVLRHVALLADIRIDYEEPDAVVTPKSAFADLCSIANKCNVRYSKLAFRALMQSLNTLRLSKKTGLGEVGCADLESVIIGSLFMDNASISRLANKLGRKYN